MAENKKFLKIEENDIDVLEQDIHELDPALLKILLSDKTTGRNIRWACDEYAKYGELYQADKEIFPRLIIGKHTQIIQPRVAKTKNEQRDRTRKVAEVFTPSWICNEMNNHCDTEWFGYKSPFNTEMSESMRVNIFVSGINKCLFKYFPYTGIRSKNLFFDFGLKQVVLVKLRCNFREQRIIITKAIGFKFFLPINHIFF